MQRDLPRSYDDLLARRYGRPSRPGERGARTIEDLLASYYGAPPGWRQKTAKPAPLRWVAQTLSDDGGEMLAQAGRPAATDEYVVEKSVDDPAVEEYVVWGMALSDERVAEVGAEAQSGRDVSVIQEFGIDLRPPLQPALPPAIAEMPQPTATHTVSSPTRATEDDFLADMQSILSGQMVFDSGSKRLVERDKLDSEGPQSENLHQQAARAEPATPSPTSTESAEAHLPAPDAKDAHDIFRRIAQSMELANAYDLGDFELEKRLSTFDRETDAAAQQRARKRSVTPARASAGSPVDSADFLHDLDAIHQERAAKSAPSETPLEAPTESSSTGG